MPLFASSTRTFPFAGALVLALPLLGAGCLEANAAQVDGGSAKEGGASSSTATSTSSSSSSATTSPPDATSSPDSTVRADGGGATIPQCMNPSTVDQACTTCDETSCASDVAPAVSACTSFYACYQACACSDSTCIMTCEQGASMTCISAVTPLLDCQKSMCAAACATSDASAPPPPSDASTSPDGGSATCKNPTATQKACGTCEESMCASTVAAEKSDCATFNQCFAACDCSDTSCIDACAESAPSACDTQLEALQSCQTGACKSACSGSADAGSTPMKDGGSASGTIPNCKNPTSTEQSTYTMCSACDTTSCDSYVTAAVGACSAYYACYAATDCSDSSGLSTCESSDITSACQSAIDNLATCQGTFCSFPCSGF